MGPDAYISGPVSSESPSRRPLFIAPDDDPYQSPPSSCPPSASGLILGAQLSPSSSPPFSPCTPLEPLLSGPRRPAADAYGENPRQSSSRPIVPRSYSPLPTDWDSTLHRGVLRLRGGRGSRSPSPSCPSSPAITPTSRPPGSTSPRSPEALPTRSVPLSERPLQPVLHASLVAPSSHPPSKRGPLRLNANMRTPTLLAHSRLPSPRLQSALLKMRRDQLWLVWLPQAIPRPKRWRLLPRSHLHPPMPCLRRLLG